MPIGQRFGRIVRLWVGNFMKGNDSTETTEAVDLSGLDLEFEVTRSVEWYDNEATITVYNPSPDSLAMLMSEGNSVLLQAGYESSDNLGNSNAGNIFVGQIASAEAMREGTDIMVTMTCLSSRGSFYQLSRLNCSVAFKKDDSIKKCLQYLCDYAGIVLRAGFEDILSKPVKHNYTMSGTFPQVVMDFAELVLFPLHKIKLYLDNNEMIILSNDNRIELEEVFLNYDSGLLEAHEIRDESRNKVNFGDDPIYYGMSKDDADYLNVKGPELQKRKEFLEKTRPSVTIERVKQIEFKALMDPMLVPNAFVDIDSYTGGEYDSVLGIRGRFVITDCQYSGGNNGSDFTVTCKAEEAPIKKG